MNLRQLVTWASVVLGVVGVFAPGVLEHAWKVLGYDADQRLILGITIALVFFVAVPLLALTLDFSDLRKGLEAKPSFTTLSQYEAMEEASKMFSGAALILNTRMIDANPAKFHSSMAGTNWNARLLSCVLSGTSYREVMSRNCKEIAVERNNALSQARGKYEVRLADNVGAFINFVIVVRDNKKTLWFGWLVSHGTTEDVVFRTEDVQMISMFEQIFNERFLSAREISS